MSLLGLEANGNKAALAHVADGERQVPLPLPVQKVKFEHLAKVRVKPLAVVKPSDLAEAVVYTARRATVVHLANQQPLPKRPQAWRKAKRLVRLVRTNEVVNRPLK